MTWHSEENPAIENDHVDSLVDWERAGQEHDFHHDKLSVGYKKPRHDSADDPANILQYPQQSNLVKHKLN